MKLVSPIDIDFVVENLRKGAVVAHRTETCYGFTADIFNKEALEKLYKVKGMSESKPCSILINSFEEASKYAEFSDKAMELARVYWPGPLTIILPRTDELPDFFNPGCESIGMRIPGDAFALGMLYLFNRPLLTTSANPHGEKECYHHKDVLEYFEDREFKPDFVVESGEIQKELPSTIVSFEDGEMKVVRQGGISL